MRSEDALVFGQAIEYTIGTDVGTTKSAFPTKRQTLENTGQGKEDGGGPVHIHGQPTGFL